MNQRLGGLCGLGFVVLYFVFVVLLILLLWTAAVSVWMLIFPRPAAQVTRA